jgi:hypothetical protein
MNFLSYIQEWTSKADAAVTISTATAITTTTTVATTTAATITTSCAIMRFVQRRKYH